MRLQRLNVWVPIVATFAPVVTTRTVGRSIVRARAKQIEAIIEAQAGLLGDVQGIVGEDAPEIESFDFDAKEASTAVVAS